MLGVRLNLPVYRNRRYGAIAEAEARIAQRRAELERQIDQVNLQVQDAYAQVHESVHEDSIELISSFPVERITVVDPLPGYSRFLK